MYVICAVPHMPRTLWISQDRSGKCCCQLGGGTTFQYSGFTTHGDFMEQQKIRAIGDQFIAQLHRIEQGSEFDVEDMAGMFAEDAQLSNPIIERDGTVRQGREGVAQFWREYRNVFSEIHSEFIDITASDHSLGLFWQSRGTDVNGQPLEYEGVSLLTLDGAGKISNFKAYFDSRQATSKTDGSLKRS